MSNTYSLVCHKTRQRIWIGQGGAEMTSLYSGDVEVMDALKKFLNEHRGEQLEFICDDTSADEIADYDEPRGF